MGHANVLEPSGPARHAGRGSAGRWARHFENNARALLPLPWQLGATLTPEERLALLPSLREFQQGEGQEGGHFYRCVERYGTRSGDLDYVVAHRLFMAEERRHARDLAEFLRCEGVAPLTTCSVLTRLFCWCGSRGGLEPTLTVILLSEVVGQAYYRAVLDATRSPLLRRLCTQILRDEHQHVRFQCEYLARLRSGRRPWLLALTHAVDALLFGCAVMACWWGHAPALRAGGRGSVRFCREAGARFRRACRLKRPASAAASLPVDPLP